MLYNATKSEKYALRVTVQHRRGQMEKFTLEQVKTLMRVWELNKSRYSIPFYGEAPLCEKIADCDYTQAELICEDYLMSLENLVERGILFKDTSSMPDDIPLSHPYLENTDDRIPRYELEDKGKAIMFFLTPISRLKNDNTKKVIINIPICIYNFFVKHGVAVIGIIKDFVK